jgi:preprotein translocase subunit SecA
MCAQRRAACVQKRAVEEVQEGLMKEAERFFLLTQIDNIWKEHLQAMTFLRQAVGLRGYGQRDPLTEYKLEGCAAGAPRATTPMHLAHVCCLWATELQAHGFMLL